MNLPIDEAFSEAFNLLLVSLVVIYSYNWSAIFIKKYKEQKQTNLPFKLILIYVFLGLIISAAVSFILYFSRASSKNINDQIYSLKAFFILIIPYLYGVLRWTYFDKISGKK